MWPFTKKVTKPERDYVGESLALRLELTKIKAEADDLWDNVDKTDLAATERALERLKELTSKGRDIHLQMLSLVVDQHQDYAQH